MFELKIIARENCTYFCAGLYFRECCRKECSMSFYYVNRIKIFKNFYGRKLAHLREFSLMSEMNSVKKFFHD